MTVTRAAGHPVRMCFVCSQYPFAPHGGIGTFVRTLAHGLNALGHYVAVIGYDTQVPETNLVHDGPVPVLRLRSPWRICSQLYRSRLPLLGYAAVPGFWAERWSLSRQVRRFAADITLFKAGESRGLAIRHGLAALWLGTPRGCRDGLRRVIRWSLGRDWRHEVLRVPEDGVTSRS